MPRSPATPACPCGSQLTFERCCAPLLEHEQFAETPEVLMRSRYCAFALGYFDYLIETHHPEYRGDLTLSQLATQDQTTCWLNLKVINAPVSAGSDEGEVHFIARYLEGDTLCELEECSRFLRIGQRWYYADGTPHFRRLENLSRNQPCPCDSGKKYKRCHQQR